MLYSFEHAEAAPGYFLQQYRPNSYPRKLPCICTIVDVFLLVGYRSGTSKSAAFKRQPIFLLLQFANNLESDLTAASAHLKGWMESLAKVSHAAIEGGLSAGPSHGRFETKADD